MPAATVIMPTHNHVKPLRLSVASAQAQTQQDFELFIVGDGVGDATRAIVAELSARDPRIRFFDFPKGPGKGEIHRHEALRHAQGRIVAYLGDDDFWMPNHLDTLDALLQDADFGHTLNVKVGADGELFALAADLENQAFRQRMINESFNRFDLTVAGHTLAAYRRLPYGWRTTPPGVPGTDFYMWLQFLNEPWCRARSGFVPTCINTSSHHRPNLTDDERVADLEHWRTQLATPAFRESLWRTICAQLVRESIHYECDAHAIRTSASWRITRPLRQAHGIIPRLFK